MEDDKKALVVTKQPSKEVDDRTLALTNQSMRVIDEESAEVPEEGTGAQPGKKKKKRSKKVLCLWCCALTGVLLLLLAVIIIILAFTVFKVRDPTITVTGTNLKGVSLGNSNTQIAISAELDTNANVHNPNAVAFKYSNTTIDLFYRGVQFAEATLAAGEIKAKSTQGIFVPVDVTLSSDDINGHLFSDLFIKRALPLVSSVNITGTVKIGIIKIKHVRISSQCNLTYSLTDQSLSSDCQYKTKI